MNLTENNRKPLALLIIVTPVVIARLLLYLHMLIVWGGTLDVRAYIDIALNLVMYIAVQKYTINYFVRKKEASMGALIFKYGIASLATLIGLKSGDDHIFILTAIMVFLVPYVHASIRAKNTKDTSLSLALILIIWGISVALAVLYIMHPLENYVTKMGKLIYNLDALNPAIEWSLFTILELARNFAAKKSR